MQYLLFSRHFYMKRGKRYHVRKVFLMFLNSAEKQLLVISCGLKKEGIERYTLDIVIGYPNLSLYLSLFHVCVWLTVSLFLNALLQNYVI